MSEKAIHAIERLSGMALPGHVLYVKEITNGRGCVKMIAEYKACPVDHTNTDNLQSYYADWVCLECGFYIDDDGTPSELKWSK